jgi:hypothetical protein
MCPLGQSYFHLEKPLCRSRQGRYPIVTPCLCHLNGSLENDPFHSSPCPLSSETDSIGARGNWDDYEAACFDFQVRWLSFMPRSKLEGSNFGVKSEHRVCTEMHRNPGRLFLARRYRGRCFLVQFGAVPISLIIT